MMNENSLRIHVVNDPTFGQNGRVVYLRDNGPCWIIDPGLPPQASLIKGHVREHGLNPAAILLTHVHADHIAGLDALREAYDSIPVYLAREEWAGLTQPSVNLSDRLGPGLVTGVTDPLDLPAGGTLDLDDSTWEIRDTAGHSPGGRSFYCAAHGVVIVGDALFSGSVGRVDFPTSDGPTLMKNIHEQLMTLPDETRVLSGHGPDTTIGEERTTNPFVLNGI